MKTRKKEERGSSQRSIGSTLFPRIRRELLTRFLAAPERRYYAGEVARMIETSLPPVRHELKILSDIGILNSAKEGQHQYYWANTDCMIYQELKGIMIKTFGVVELIHSALAGQSDKLLVAFLYGSIATQTDTARSDIDLFVVGSISYREMTVALSKVEDKLGRPVNPTLFSPAELTEKYRNGNHFIRAVWDAEKTFIIGTENDLEAVVR
jgi:predicted nucleotidyltransferase